MMASAASRTCCAVKGALAAAWFRSISHIAGQRRIVQLEFWPARQDGHAVLVLQLKLWLVHLKAALDAFGGEGRWREGIEGGSSGRLTNSQLGGRLLRRVFVHGLVDL